MSSPANPLVGSGWNAGPQGGSQQQSQLFNNPLQVGAVNTNPGGYGNPQGANEINRNMGLTNIAAGQIKNKLAPQFAQLMGQYGGQAGNFFQNLMNLGSPYYAQKQAEGFTQGQLQNQNAAAQARQQLGAQGYGYTPSGAQAAMLGGMAQQGAQNLSEQYLQNLFQNEQMQGLGAQGLSSLAGMFNPAQLLGGTSLGANVQAPSNFFQNFSDIMGSLTGAGYSGGGAGGATTIGL